MRHNGSARSRTLSAQDVVAMARSGQSEQQIAMAVQQRGANLRSTPGVSQYLAQNGVNPAVLGVCARPDGRSSRRPDGRTGGRPVSGSLFAAGRDERSAGCFCANANTGRPSYNPAMPNGVTSATYPAARGMRDSFNPQRMKPCLLRRSTNRVPRHLTDRRTPPGGRHPIELAKTAQFNSAINRPSTVLVA